MNELSKTVCAVVPIKAIATAKSRLADVLTADERKALVAAMAKDVIGALKNCSAIDHVIIITDDNEVVRLARKLGCIIWPQGPEEGLSAAMNHAASRLRSLQVSTMISVHGDLPLANAKAFDGLLKKVNDQSQVMLLPSDLDDGTNVVVTSPPDILTFNYGQNSYYRHLDYCLRRNIHVATLWDDDLDLDIDTAADIRLLLDKKRCGRISPNTMKFFAGCPRLYARVNMLPGFLNNSDLLERFPK